MNSATEAAPSFAGLSLDKPRLFGVINVTPDSFSDGGEALALSEARAASEGVVRGASGGSMRACSRAAVP